MLRILLDYLAGMAHAIIDMLSAAVSAFAGYIRYLLVSAVNGLVRLFRDPSSVDFDAWLTSANRFVPVDEYLVIFAAYLMLTFSLYSAAFFSRISIKIVLWAIPKFGT